MCTCPAIVKNTFVDFLFSDREQIHSSRSKSVPALFGRDGPDSRTYMVLHLAPIDKCKSSATNSSITCSSRGIGNSSGNSRSTNSSNNTSNNCIRDSTSDNSSNSGTNRSMASTRKNGGMKNEDSLEHRSHRKIMASSRPDKKQRQLFFKFVEGLKNNICENPCGFDIDAVQMPKRLRCGTTKASGTEKVRNILHAYRQELLMQSGTSQKRVEGKRYLM